MKREYGEVMEAYESQVLYEGIIWDGLKWVIRKLRGSADRKKDTTKRSAAAGAAVKSETPKADKTERGSTANGAKGVSTANDLPLNSSKCSFTKLPDDAVAADYRYWVKKYDYGRYADYANLCGRRDTEWRILTYGGEPIAITALNGGGRRIAASFAIGREASERRIAACETILGKRLL